MCVSEYQFVRMRAGPPEARSCHQIPLELESEAAVRGPAWVLGAELRPSARGEGVRNL